MTENFFTSMCMDGGKISSKRVIAVTMSAVLAWGIAYAIAKALNTGERLSVLIATMAFIALLVGVASLPQILSIIRPGAVPPPDTKQEPTDENP